MNTLPHREEIEEIIDYTIKEAKDYIKSIDDLHVRQPDYRPVLDEFNTPFPEEGRGGMTTMRLLIDKGFKATVTSAGPRFFHFVVGGVTPAAMGADLLSPIIDQIAYAHVTSPLAVHLELISLNWLKEIFGIPQSWGAIMVTGGTMAIYIGMIAARQWVGEYYGLDIYQDGMRELPDIPIFASNILHASDVKVVGMLGFGSSTIDTVANEAGIFDLELLEQKLKKRGDHPSIIIAVAGEPNAGLFDQIPELVELSRKYNVWLHVDGAFGLFAKVDSRTEHLLDHLEEADSIAVDGHKWLNVPYDCGFGFVRDQELMEKSFRYAAEYLPDWSEEEPVMGVLGPESSRRARSIAVWATLHAYGKSGLRSLISKNIDQARYLAELVQAEQDLELLEEVIINVVCFRFKPEGYDEEELDKLNAKLGQAILDDGRVYLGTTTYQGKTALRPAIVNWRTENGDIELMVKVILELAHGLLTE